MTTLKTALDDPATVKTDTLVIGVAKGPKGLVLAGGGASVDAAMGGKLLATLRSLGATGGSGEVTKVPTMGVIPAATVLAVGLGGTGLGNTEKVVFSHEVIRRAAGVATRALAGGKRAACTLALANTADTASTAEGAQAPETDVAAVAEGVLMGGYRFGDYRTGTDAGKQPVTAVTLLGVGKKSAAAARAAVIAESVALVRDLVNTAPRDLPPAVFAERAEAAATAAGLTVEILDEEALAAGGYGGIVGVGQGSIRPPRLVRLEHMGVGPTVAIIGKGITFDSGGLSLKPPTAMETMKSDMAGAAATLGTLLAAARLDLPVHVIGYLPMAENMPSGTAIRPSDILTMYGGKTVEVLNTDAEGRLVLGDALVRSGEDNPALVVDIATLTGAQVVALGNRVSAVMGTDAGRARVVAAADDSGEAMWPMPLPEELRPSIDSEIADLQNIGDRAGGMLTAGLFLKEFAPANAEWAHIDIAGPSYNSGAAHGYTPKGGTGIGVRTLVTMLEAIATNGM